MGTRLLQFVPVPVPEKVAFPQAWAAQPLLASPAVVSDSQPLLASPTVVSAYDQPLLASPARI